MKTSLNGRKFIAKEEGNILYAYDDFNEKRVNPGDTVRGTITIGVGHTTAAGAPKVVPGMIISEKQSLDILASDLIAVENTVNKLVKVPLNQNQFDALVSFQFNTGGLGRSRLLALLNNKDYKGAADAFMGWTRANGDPNLLRGRRTRERALFLTKTSKLPENTAVVATSTVGIFSLWQWGHDHWALILGITAVSAYVIYKLIKHYKNSKVNDATNTKDQTAVVVVNPTDEVKVSMGKQSD